MITVLTNIESSIIRHIFSSHLIQMDLVMLVKISDSISSVNITCKVYICNFVRIKIVIIIFMMNICTSS